jgi:pyrroline-5-carboxylate reductase
VVESAVNAVEIERIGFVGGGVMAEAIIRALLSKRIVKAK